MDRTRDFERLSRLMLDEFKRMHERFDEMKIEFGSLASEVADIHRRLDALEQAVGNVTGFAKEIDHILVRVSAIEKHLGLTGFIRALEVLSSSTPIIARGTPRPSRPSPAGAAQP